MTVKLYSTHCPKCRVLETKLKSKGISYEEIDDVELMKSMGISSLPVLGIDDKLLTFTEANTWIKEQNKQE